jgi:hypothetical protein
MFTTTFRGCAPRTASRPGLRASTLAIARAAVLCSELREALERELAAAVAAAAVAAATQAAAGTAGLWRAGAGGGSSRGSSDEGQGGHCKMLAGQSGPPWDGGGVGGIRGGPCNSVRSSAAPWR